MNAAPTRSDDRPAPAAAPRGRAARRAAGSRHARTLAAAAEPIPSRRPRAYPRSLVLPSLPVRARGMIVEGADGRRWLDATAGAGGRPLGHNHPAVLDAVAAAADAADPAARYAEDLLATLPPELAADARVRFCTPRGPFVPRPRGAAPVCVEPLHTDDTVLWRVRLEATARGVPLVADETHTGLGRTGALWAFGHSGVVPDALVLAHAAGSGPDLAVVVHRAGADLGAPDGTFPGNRAALAAAAATLAHVREHRLDEHAAAVGARLRAGLGQVADRADIVGEIGGRGLVASVRIVDPDGGPCLAPELAAAVRRAALCRELLVETRDTVVRLALPLVATAGQADAVVGRLGAAICAVARDRRPGSRVRGGD